MLLPRAARYAFALLALCQLAACDDPLSPRDVAGTYVLRLVRGQMLPAVLSQSEGWQRRVLADTLRLNADGTGSEVWLLEYTGQYASESGRSERPLLFEVHDGRLEGAYLCPASGFCLTDAQSLRGSFTRAGLRLEVALFGEVPLEFVRVDR